MTSYFANDKLKSDCMHKENFFSKVINKLSTPADGALDILILQPTPFCNLNCSYCYLPHRSVTDKMSIDTVKTVIDKVLYHRIAKKDQITLCWHAGEPMTAGLDFYKEATTLIESLKPPKLKIKYDIQTNGTMIDEQWCDFFKNFGYNVGVSIDGPEEIHNFYRKSRSGNGSFKSVMKGIKLLQMNGVPFHTISVLSERNLQSADEMFDFFLKNEILSIGFNILEKEGINTQGLDINSFEKTKAFFSRFYDLNASNNFPLHIRELSDKSVAPYISSSSFWSPVTHQCNEPFRIITITHDGGIGTFSPELIGIKNELYNNFVWENILTHTLDDVIKNPAYRAANSEIIKGIQLCQSTCKYFNICAGGNPSNKIAENGSFNSSATVHCLLSVAALAEVILEKEANPTKVRS